MFDLSKIQEKLKSAEERYISVLAKKEMIDGDIIEVEKKIENLNFYLRTSKEVQIFTQKQIDLQRKVLSEKFSSIITYGNTVVYQNDIKFLVKDSDDLSSAQFKLVRNKNGAEVEEPIVGFSGGGLRNLICFLLNVVILLLYNPQRRRFLSFDERFGGIDTEGRSERVSELLAQLAEKTGIQFIMASHKPGLVECGDKIYRAEMDHLGRTKYILT